MRKLTLAIALTMILIVACSTPNLYLASEVLSPDFKFNRREKVILVLPKDASAAEIEYYDKIKAGFIEEEFLLVDTLPDADRIVSYTLHEDHTFRSSVSVHNELLSMGNRRYNLNTEEAGYTTLTIEMFDIGAMSSGRKLPIWAAMLSTHSENFDTDLSGIITQILKLYGKDKSKKGRFRPSN